MTQAKFSPSLREGLPQQHCYDPVFCHALAGRGDSRRCLAHNLAVMYSARFIMR